eukprot:359429-Chlamydomonas_euryale.AAC.2
MEGCGATLRYSTLPASSPARCGATLRYSTPPASSPARCGATLRHSTLPASSPACCHRAPTSTSTLHSVRRLRRAWLRGRAPAQV